MPEIPIDLPEWHEKQEFAFNSIATDILYAGDTRSGKSFWVRKSYIIYAASIPGWTGDIFRVNYDDVYKNHMIGETSFPALLENWERNGLCTINKMEVIFWNESRFTLEHCADMSAIRKHQGIAKHCRTLEESAQMDPEIVRSLMGWVTMSEEMKSRLPERWRGQFPKVFHTTNTIGPSAGYYRRTYVEARKPYSIEKVGPWMRQYIPAFVDDNPSEDPETTRLRIAETFPDKAIQDAFISKDPEGIRNWQTRAGEFFPEWSEARHVVPDLIPPPHFTRYRTFDWGTADPAVVFWIAISDGDPFRDSNGKQRWFPRGALIFYNEWYICDPENPAKGCRMRNEDMAHGIFERSEYQFRDVPILTDSLPFQDRGGLTIAQVFANTFRSLGCSAVLTQGDTSRPAGWAHLRSRLIGEQIDSNDDRRDPMIYFTECCKYARDYIPALTRHPSEGKKEDAAERGEATHACDAIRLACMAHTIIKDRAIPMQNRIEKELALRRPSPKNILGSNYRKFFV